MSQREGSKRRQKKKGRQSELNARYAMDKHIVGSCAILTLRRAWANNCEQNGNQTANPKRWRAPGAERANRAAPHASIEPQNASPPGRMRARDGKSEQSKTFTTIFDFVAQMGRAAHLNEPNKESETITKTLCKNTDT